MKATAKARSDVSDFFKREILGTRISVDRARRESWKERFDLVELQSQERLRTSIKKK